MTKRRCDKNFSPMNSTSWHKLLLLRVKMLRFPNLRGNGSLKYGDVQEKFIFLETQDSKPLRTGQKHFETILPNFPPDECKI